MITSLIGYITVRRTVHNKYFTGSVFSAPRLNVDLLTGELIACGGDVLRETGVLIHRRVHVLSSGEPWRERDAHRDIRTPSGDLVNLLGVGRQTDPHGQPKLASAAPRIKGH